MNFTCVVEWAKDFRTDTLHVPKMKIFVGDRTQELPVRRLAHEVVFTDGDACGVEMLEPAVSALRLNFEEEGVLLIRGFAEDGDARFHNLFHVGFDLWRSHRYVGFAEHQAMIRSGSLKLEYFELADECRRVDEDVIVPGVITVASFFQTCVDLPVSWNAVLHTVGHMLLSNDVHESRRRRHVGHLIRQQP